MKKAIKFLAPVVIIMCLILCACGGNGGNAGSSDASGFDTSMLEGKSADEILSAIDEGASAEFDIFSSELDAESANSIFMIGDDVYGSITSAAVHTPFISTSAHMTAAFECADDTAAEEVAAAVADGFNCLYWVCVSPDKVEVTTCGNYVLFLATSENCVEAYEGAVDTLLGEGNHTEWVEITSDNAGSQAAMRELGGA